MTPHSYQCLADNNNIQTKAVFRVFTVMGKHVQSGVTHSITYHFSKKKKKGDKQGTYQTVSKFFLSCFCLFSSGINFPADIIWKNITRTRAVFNCDLEFSITHKALESGKGSWEKTIFTS